LSDEEEVSKKTLPPPKQRDEYESSGADSGDDYVQEKHQPSVVGKARKIKRKRTLDADGQPRKRKRRVPVVEPDLTELTPEQGDIKLRLAMRFVLTTGSCSATDRYAN